MRPRLRQATLHKYEYRIPMRDGVHLFTAVYVPKDSSRPYPFLIDRTPYSVSPYGWIFIANSLGRRLTSIRRDTFSCPGRPRPLYVGGNIYRNASAHRQQEIQTRCGRQQRSLRHHRLAAEERTQPQWERRHLGDFVPGFFTSASIIDSHPALKPHRRRLP